VRDVRRGIASVGTVRTLSGTGIRARHRTPAPDPHEIGCVRIIMIIIHATVSQPFPRCVSRVLTSRVLGPQSQSRRVYVSRGFLIIIIIFPILRAYKMLMVRPHSSTARTWGTDDVRTWRFHINTSSQI